MCNNFLESAKWISNEYRDLNGTTIEVLEQPPSSVEFARLVHISRPVIIKGFQFSALSSWTDEYLKQRMGTREISVAVTPNGLADAITPGPDGKHYFVEPCIEKMTIEALLASLPDSEREVHYLQSQNGNLFSSASFENPPDKASDSEFEPLLGDVPKEIPWFSETLGQHPDAVNIWIGNEKSVTSMHSDPYENFYTVVRGEKDFFLLPPTDSWCLKERLYPHAYYSRQSGTRILEILPSGPDMPHVRWSSIPDPALPGALPEEITPIRIKLRAGESLYLPVGWWHYVRQSGLTIALNWWYDAEMRGMTWAILNFLRNVTPITEGN